MEFAAVFSNTLGRTQLAEHRIECGPARPIWQSPYSISHAYRAAVQQEIKEMLEGDIIEPSSSEWCSPMVVVHTKLRCRGATVYRTVKEVCTHAGDLDGTM